jgi:hypothetical protein
VTDLADLGSVVVLLDDVHVISGLPIEAQPPGPFSSPSFPARKIPQKIPHTSATRTNQTDLKQHDCLKFQDSINQNNTAKQYGTRS